MSRRRAIGIVRVSQVAGREGNSFASPTAQRERIQAEADRQHLDLIAVYEELDVSGGADLENRPGLRPALERIEHGEAEVLIAAYFDRFFRGMTVQAQVIARVEAAGGQVLAVDFGLVSHTTATQWLSASVTGMMAEYYRRSAGERNAENIQRAINRGAPPVGRVTAGYLRRDDGTYAPDPRHAPAVRAAFERRASGQTVREVRQHLDEHGIHMTYAGVSKLLASRIVLGEIHFGSFTPNLHAHDPIVARATWEAVQRTRVPAGRNTKSPRLLARLGVLVCGTCGARMSANLSTWRSGETYPVYRCQHEDCTHHVSITAEWAEDAVVDAVRAHLAGMEGRASAETGAAEAGQALERAQSELDAAIRTLSVVGDEPATIQRLSELRAARDQARAETDRLSGLRAALRVDPSLDWDRLTIDEKRGLIGATVERAVVAPGRARDRVSVLFFE